MTRNFTVGPVTIEAEMRAIAAEPLPYFRDDAFAEVVRRVDRGLCALVGGSADTRAALLTASGTAAMEAAVINLFGPEHRVLVIEGGSFGRRFVEICRAHAIPHEVASVAPGRDLDLDALPSGGFDGVLVQAHETSTGQRFDLQALGAWSAERGAHLVVDAISAVLADPLSMSGWNIGTLVVSSNKGLAVSPGLSAVIMDGATRAQMREPASLYLRLGPAFTNAERGMTPYTPAIGVIRQLARRLDTVASDRGAATIAATAARATHFRAGLARLGVPTFPQTPSNYLTALVVRPGTSRALYETLRDRHGILINPSTWGFETEVPKVCHAGDLTLEDHDVLLDALAEELPRLEALPTPGSEGGRHAEVAS